MKKIKEILNGLRTALKTAQSHHVYFYKRMYFVKVNIDGSVFKKIQTETN